jgi:hypothetical protein
MTSGCRNAVMPENLSAAIGSLEASSVAGWDDYRGGGEPSEARAYAARAGPTCRSVRPAHVQGRVVAGVLALTVVTILPAMLSVAVDGGPLVP